MEIKPRDRDMKSPTAELVKGDEFKSKRKSTMGFWKIYNRLHEIAEAEGMDFIELAEGVIENQGAVLESLRRRKRGAPASYHG